MPASRASERGGGRPLLQLGQPQFRYEPFPIGLSRGVFEAEFYGRLLREWPETGRFAFMPQLGKKYSLSERNNPDAYHAHLRASPAWRAVYEEIKSPGFVERLLSTLAAARIDLELAGGYRIVGASGRGWPDRVADAVAALRGRRPPVRLSARFEYSMLPADGGSIKPHTDSPGKIATLVVAMVGPGEWNPAYGGGTAVLRARAAEHQFNHVNRQLEFDQVDTLWEYPFEPNQCVLFIKTFNSLHAVAPLTGRGSPLMRRTLTINIEQV